jgi:hypothetical protein
MGTFAASRRGSTILEKRNAGGDLDMVITVLEAKVSSDKEDALRGAYATAVASPDELSPSIVETFLVRQADSDVWRIFTVWRSREELEDYRRSVETPRGVLIFRAAGAEPTLLINEVVARAAP